MPGDRLPLPVKIGGEPDIIGPFGQSAQLSDRLGLPLVDDIGGGEVVVEVDAGNWLFGAFGGFARQVANVADRGFHHKSWAQIFFDRLGFGGALHDDQLVALAAGRCRRAAA